MEELRDEDVHLEDVGDVLALHVAQHVDEPLEVPVRRADPQEVHLATIAYQLGGNWANWRVSIQRALNLYQGAIFFFF